MSATHITPPPRLGRYSEIDIHYTLSVVQNPIRARCCGFGEKDRRPIDPPPILELRASDSNGNRINLKPEDSTLFLVQCELYNVDQDQNRTLVYTPWSTAAAATTNSNDNVQNSNTKQRGSGKPEYVRNLIGSSVSNAYHLYNEYNQPGTYFIFHDLSVRTEGTFKLKFEFFNISAGGPLTRAAQVDQETFSSPFSVYPAKKFPGLTESTSLSRCFSKQGIKIPIRNECQTKRAHKSTTSNDVYEYPENPIYREPVQEEQLSSTPRPKYTRLPISDFLLPEE